MVGNGAAELINVLGHVLKGKIAISIPAFNEYIRCFEDCDIVKINSADDGYKLDVEKLINQIDNVDIITIINPDNPSGDFIEYNDIIRIIEKASKANKRVIIDESFIDFADSNKKYTLLQSELLKKYKNLIVIKSISKSYGIPGIRLGILASGDRDLLEKIKEKMAVWNINSYAEYFLQIATLYKNDYEVACRKIAEERKRFYEKLKNIKYIVPYESQANYIMCKMKNGDSTELANYLISYYNILIKDLKNKDGFKEKNYIRLAVKTNEENEELIEALKKYENEKIKEKTDE